MIQNTDSYLFYCRACRTPKYIPSGRSADLEPSIDTSCAYCDDVTNHVHSGAWINE